MMLPPPKPPQAKANKQFDVVSFLTLFSYHFHFHPKTCFCLQLLPPDVLEIMKANKDFYKKMCKNPPCIIKTANPAPPIPATLPSDPAPEVRIPYIQSPKPLKMTPKRVGSWWIERESVREKNKQKIAVWYLFCCGWCVRSLTYIHKYLQFSNLMPTQCKKREFDINVRFKERFLPPLNVSHHLSLFCS